MSGYLHFSRTGHAAFDAVLDMIENAGNGYHHTSQWQDEGDGGEPSYCEQIEELIQAAAKSVSEPLSAAQEVPVGLIDDAEKLTKFMLDQCSADALRDAIRNILRQVPDWAPSFAWHSALLAAPWKLYGEHDDLIRGQWAEDGFHYLIECPKQLAPLLVEAQNRAMLSAAKEGK